MKESKAVYVTRRDLKQNFDKIHEIYSNKLIKERFFLPYTHNNRDIGCQFDSTRNNLIRTCRNVSTYRRRDMTYFSGLAKQIYAYHGTRSYTDVGVGSVKALPKKKVKKVYLPETGARGVGSEDLSAYFNRRNRQRGTGSYYDHKRTSSKCVGGVVEHDTGCVISVKLSPIVQTQSGTTSPRTSSLPTKNVEIGSNTVEKHLMTITTQIENELLKTYKQEETAKFEKLQSVFVTAKKYSKVSNENKEVDHIIKVDNLHIQKKRKYIERTISSDSLVQHVHNLEIPSEDKQSQLSLYPMENKLEREYRNMFATKENNNEPSIDKPFQDLKSASILRRRFEALRRGFVKKDNSKKKAVIINKLSSEISRRSRRDVSIVSDPPSLEGRSYSNTKTYSPFHFNMDAEKSIYNPSTLDNKTYTEKKEIDSSQWSRFDNRDSEYQGVKGMFRLWGKKFNLEEDYYKKKPTPIPSFEIIKSDKKSEQLKNAPKIESENKKEGKKFFFFRKKIKDNPKQPFKPKKSVTAGRCELRDGVMIKIGGNLPQLEEDKKRIDISEEILRKPWLMKYLSQPIESRNSVQIRWNNKTYATNSSTVFELMDTVYNETGVVFRSKSQVTTGESSYFKSSTQHVNFARQEIEAWMIANTVQDKPKQLPFQIKCKSKDNIEVRISDQKWFIDKSKAFSHKIEVVLHSNNLVRSSQDSSSSEYLRIDIPKSFFIDSSSSVDGEKNQSSDEKVFKIVEYETESDSKKNKQTVLETGDHKGTDIEVIVSVKDSNDYKSSIQETVIKRPPGHRDVVIQSSNVKVPKRCDIISVGIITQRDLRETRKSILKTPEDLSDEDSFIDITQTPKKCEFAESYLQDYYRNWTPLGLDIFSWCVSDSHLQCCSEYSGSSFHPQGDGSKSCPNIYDDFQASTGNDPCGPCIPCSIVSTSDDEKPDNTFACKLFNKLKTRAKIGPHECCKRILPKDSFEVFKRRKVYAASNKYKWACPSYGDVKPYSVPSIEDKEAQDTTVDCPKLKKPCYRPTEAKLKKKTCKKHVSMPDCEMMNETLARQLAERVPEGILSFKGAAGCETCKKLEQKCPKHAVIDKNSVCKILDPPCKEDCMRDKKAPCSRSSSKSGDSPICISKPKTPPSPCKTPPSCKPLPPCNPPPIRRPPPSCTPTPPFRHPKSPPVVKKYSPLSKEPSPCASCKKTCQLSPTSQMQTVSPPRNSCPLTPPCCKKPSPTKKPSPICSHFPPSKKTQSSQISPKHSPQNLEPARRQQCPRLPRNKYSPQKTPQSKKCTIDSIPRCDSCISNKKEKNSSHPSRCNTPPCRKPSPPRNEIDDKFPWPLKNQVSNQPSLDSLACQPRRRQSLPKNSNQCKKTCPLTPNFSNQSLMPVKKRTKEKECKPDCANMPKMQKRMPCPLPSTSPPAPTCPPSPPSATRSKPKISGLFLKMKPSQKKTCSKDCLGGQYKKDDNVIRLSSNEKITIRLKHQTPSTEEIREGMNIIVKDIDGETLYERRDYRQNYHNRAASILGDMYKASNINTVSTPITIKNVQTSDIKNQKVITESRSDASVANLIEIQFKLKVMQGDKTTEINIANDEDNENKTQMSKNDINQPQDVFIVKNTEEHFNEKIAPKNDVDIRIVIKNYKHNLKIKENGYNDDYSKKISEKFHTVSTGYSDICSGQNVDNVYSIHRATIDLTSSTEKSKTQSRPSDDFTSTELVEKDHVNFTASSNSTKPSESESKIIAANIEQKSISTNRSSRNNSRDFQTDTQDEDFNPVSDIEDQEILDVNAININSKGIIDKHISKKEKKELLRKVFEKANDTKTKNKNKMKELRDMLKIILTSDSSGSKDIAVTSNELAKDVTYASLKPNYFRDTDSLNNYYKINSKVSLDGPSIQKYYPTEEGNSECTVNSEDTPEINTQGCMCSTLAERLNLCNTGEDSCCCRGTSKKNEETCCDLRNEDDFILLHFKTAEIVDVETHNSKYIASKINSTKRSNVKSGIKSSVTKNSPVVLTQYEEIVNINEAKEGRIEKYSPNKIRNGGCNVKKLNRNTTLHISNGDEIIIVKTKPTRLSADVREKDRDEMRKKTHHKSNRNETKLTNLISQADILQSYETKKAVLEMYTENTLSDEGEHFVAKLPKFIYDTDVRNYEQIVTNYESICRNNVLITSIQK